VELKPQKDNEFDGGKTTKKKYKTPKLTNTHTLYNMKLYVKNQSDVKVDVFTMFFQISKQNQSCRKQQSEYL
jgi:hypothetical protein